MIRVRPIQARMSPVNPAGNPLLLPSVARGLGPQPPHFLGAQEFETSGGGPPSVLRVWVPSSLRPRSPGPQQRPPPSPKELGPTSPGMSLHLWLPFLSSAPEALSCLGPLEATS